MVIRTLTTICKYLFDCQAVESLGSLQEEIAASNPIQRMCVGGQSDGLGFANDDLFHGDSFRLALQAT